jgi:hypothetical protein
MFPSLSTHRKRIIGIVVTSDRSRIESKMSLKTMLARACIGDACADNDYFKIKLGFLFGEGENAPCQFATVVCDVITKKDLHNPSS